MPSMANVTVKNAAGTDTTATAIVASAGDKSPARWEIVNSSVPKGLLVNFELSSRWNTARTARHLTTIVTVPYYSYDSGSSLFTLVDKVFCKMELVVPQSIVQGYVDDAADYATSFMRAALPVSCYKAGYSPT